MSRFSRVSNNSQLVGALTNGDTSIELLPGDYGDITITDSVDMLGVGQVTLSSLTVSSGSVSVIQRLSVNQLVVNGSLTTQDCQFGSASISGTLVATSCSSGPITASPVASLTLNQCQLAVDSAPSFIETSGNGSGGQWVLRGCQLDVTNGLPSGFEILAARNGVSVEVYDSSFRASPPSSGTLYIVNTSSSSPAGNVVVSGVTLVGTQNYDELSLSLISSPDYTRLISDLTYDNSAAVTSGFFVDQTGSITTPGLNVQGQAVIEGSITSSSGDITLGNNSIADGQIVLDNTTQVNGALLCNYGITTPVVYSDSTLHLGGASGVKLYTPTTFSTDVTIDNTLRVSEIISPIPTLILGVDPDGSNDLITLSYKDGNTYISTANQTILYQNLVNFLGEIQTSRITSTSNTLTLSATDPPEAPPQVVIEGTAVMGTSGTTSTSLQVNGSAIIGQPDVTGISLTVNGPCYAGIPGSTGTNLVVEGNAEITGSLLSSTNTLTLGQTGTSVVIPGSLFVDGEQVFATLLGPETALVSPSGSDPSGQTNNAETPFRTIQAAINAAPNVLVAPGTYSGDITIPSGGTYTITGLAPGISITSSSDTTTVNGSVHLTNVVVPSLVNNGTTTGTDSTFQTISNYGTISLRNCRYTGSSSIGDNNSPSSSSSGGSLDTIDSFTISLRDCSLESTANPLISGTGRWRIIGSHILIDNLNTNIYYLLSPTNDSTVVVDDCSVTFIDSSITDTFSLIVAPPPQATICLTNVSVVGTEGFSGSVYTGVPSSPTNVANNISFDHQVSPGYGLTVGHDGTIQTSNIIAAGSAVVGTSGSTSTNLTVNGAATITDALNVDGPTTVGSNSFSTGTLLTVNGSADVTDNLTVSGSFNVNTINLSGSLTVDGTSALEGATTVGTTTTSADLTVNGNTTVTGTSALEGATTIGTTTTSADLTVNGNTTVTGTTTIGTTTTSTNLTVKGNASFGGITGDSLYVGGPTSSIAQMARGQFTITNGVLNSVFGYGITAAISGSSVQLTVNYLANITVHVSFSSTSVYILSYTVAYNGTTNITITVNFYAVSSGTIASTSAVPSSGTLYVDVIGEN